MIKEEKNQARINSTAQELIKKYSTSKTFEDRLGVQAEIDKEIKILLKVWISVDGVEKKDLNSKKK